jgi:hypothetical protein
VIKHIVLWRLKDSAGGRAKAGNARLLTEMLEALNGKIAGRRRLEVDINVHDSHSADGAGVVLYAKFGDMAALEACCLHPEHLKARPLAQSARAERRVINYEVQAGGAHPAS